jgi:uncharacterized membrane protein (UPF0182 family)
MTRRWGLVLLAAAALTLLAGRWASVVYAEWRWHEAIGALDVYRSALMHDAAWRIATAVVAFAFAFLNLYALRRSIVSLVLPRRLGNLEIGEVVPGRRLLAVVVALSAVIALALSSPRDDWSTFALARIAGPFREMDPYLDRDLSFVVAWLPFERQMHEWAEAAVVVVAMLTVALYALTPSLRLRRGGLYVSAWCRRHLATLAAVGIVLLAWQARLDSLGMTSLVDDAGQGFGVFEHRIGMTAAMWGSLATFGAAFIVFWAGWHGHGRIAAAAGILACLAGPLILAGLPSVTTRGLTDSERLDTDRPYAATRRLFTRRAFGVDAIDTAQSRLEPLATAVTGVPSWDPVAAERAAGSGIEGDRWLVWQPGRPLRAVAVAAPHPIGDEHWTGEWVDPVVPDERGRLLGALPPPSPAPVAFSWERLVSYDGAAGVLLVADTGGHSPSPPFDTRLDRLAHAWNQRAPWLMAEQGVPARPRIAFRRDVRERVQAYLPFLTQGPTGAAVVRADTLYWAVELFTTSDSYPLTAPLMFAGAPRRYVHHAATAYVNAVTGGVLCAMDPGADAIMRTWMRRFPRACVAESAAPPDLVANRPPSVDWTAVQAAALSRIGLGVAPGSTGRLSIGVDNADTDLAAGGPAFTAGSDGRLIWSAPMVDAAGAVRGVLVAAGGPVAPTRWVPAAEPIPWGATLDRLQRTADSAGFSRPSRNPRRGHVITVPSSDGLGFVQSHYEWPADDGPALTGVVAIAGGTARAGPTAGAALGEHVATDGAGNGGLRAAAAALHVRMSDALRRGDWAAFGAAFEALGRLLGSPRR